MVTLSSLKRLVAISCAFTFLVACGDDTTPAVDATSDTQISINPDTAVPEGDTTAPEEDTNAPEEDTTAPEEDTAAPEEDTAAPEEDTTAPEEDTTAPEEDTTAPEEDTMTPPEDTTPPAKEGACTNEADQAIVDSTDVEAIAKDCGFKNFASPEKAAACIKEGTGLSDECVVCFSSINSCAATNCLLDCIKPDSPKCLECVNEKCMPEFEECSGLDTTE